MTRFPTSRRVVPTSLMALGFAATVLGLLGISPVSADEGSFGEEVPVTIDTSSGQTTTIPETTTTVPQTTTTVPQTTTTVPQTTTTVPQTTSTTVPQTTTTVPQTTSTTVPETTTTVPQTTTTAAVTTTTAPATTTTVAVSVLPTTTIRWYTTSTGSLAVTGSDTSLPMVGIGAGLFVAGVVLLRVRTRREA